MMRVLSSFGIIAPAAFLLCAPALHAQRFGNPDVLAPDFPSPEAVVEKMLEAAHLKPGETLYDLGSGEGLRTLRSERPYERLDITGLKGLTEAQKATLWALGAIEQSPA